MPRRPRARPPLQPEQLIEEMLDNVRGMLADGVRVGDLKIADKALEELRRGFRMFATYGNIRKVSTFGSARTQPGDPTFRLAERFARRMAEAGYMVITGAGPGIMEACQRGAGREHSFGMNIVLPFEQQANPVIHGDPKLLSFRYFFTRKLFFIKEAHALVCFPGGFGTHDEGFEALTLVQTGKSRPMPIVFLDAPRDTYWKTWNRYVHDHILRRGMISEEDLSLYLVTDSVDQAVNEITTFYSVYHSSRYVKDIFVMRLNRRLPEAFVTRLGKDFADIMDAGGIVQRDAFPEEAGEPGVDDLPRLAFRFNRSSLGRLRIMIDKINQAPGAVNPLQP